MIVFLKNLNKKNELKAKSGQIFYCLQNLLIYVSLARFNSTLFDLYQVSVYVIYI